MPLITIIGAGPGVSQSVATLWGEKGYSVALVARNEVKLKAQAQALTESGVRAYYATADAIDSDSLRQALSFITRQAGPTEVLLYNVSMAPPGFIPRNIVSQETPERLAQEFMAGAINAVTAVQAVLPAMQVAGKGTILLTGGGSALQPQADYGSLALQKAGIRNLAQQLHQTLHSKQGIRVGTVTIMGSVDPASDRYNPDVIARQLWKIHSGEVNDWEIQW